METRQETKCLNCGNLFEGNYCPTCGQAATTQRLQPKNLFTGFLMGLTRVNGSFFYTMKELLLHPWQVVSHYISGRRVRYTHPAIMLFLLATYYLLLASWCGISQTPTPSIDIDADISLRGKQFYDGAMVILNNLALCYFFFIIPSLTLALHLVWNKACGGKYNMAEYFYASIIMTNYYLIGTFIVLPLAFVMKDLNNFVLLLVMPVAGFVALRKAFPMPTAPFVARYVAFLLLSLLFSVLLVGFVAVVIAVCIILL